MVAGWMLGLVANGTIAAAYFAVALVLARNIQRSKQWFVNPLAAATAFIFFTCAGGHAIYLLQFIDLARGAGTAAAAGAAVLYAEWHMWGWDLITASVGVLYWTLRKKLPGLVTGTAVYEDLRVRQKRAMEINDSVVQGVVRAKLSLDLRRDEEGCRVLGETLTASKRIVHDLSPTRKGAS